MPPHCPNNAAVPVLVAGKVVVVLDITEDVVVDIFVIKELVVVNFVAEEVVVTTFVEVEVAFEVVALEDVLEETITPSTEHGKSKSAVEAMFVQKYSLEPVDPTRLVPTAVISVQISLQTSVTTSLLLVPVPLTLM